VKTVIVDEETGSTVIVAGVLGCSANLQQDEFIKK
jgi:hypothetical protein